MTVSTMHTTKHGSCFDLQEMARQDDFLQALFEEAMDDGDHQQELAHRPVKYSGLALLNTVNAATPNHQATKDVCSHLIGALKDETTFETHHSQKPRNRQVAATPPGYVKGTCLSDKEFRDALHLWY